MEGSLCFHRLRPYVLLEHCLRKVVDSALQVDAELSHLVLLLVDTFDERLEQLLSSCLYNYMSINILGGRG